MHDPLCVAFEIRRPWPKGKNGARRRFPPMITVWHREPHGHDSGTVCPYASHRLHPWHWTLQVHALQTARRRLLTRCAWCGGRSRRDDVVNHSHQWDGPRSRWWRGERGLFHRDCSMISNAHAACVCESPITEHVSAEFGPYGRCTSCDKTRPFGRTDEQRAFMRDLASVGVGQRKASLNA